MTAWFGDVSLSTVVSIPFTTHTAAGANVAPSSAFEIEDIRVYKGSSATQRASSAGMTMTSPFDSLTGVHMLSIDTSNNADAGFWGDGNLYHVMLVPDETIDGQAVTAHLGSFGISYGTAARAVNLIGAPNDFGNGDTLAGNLIDVYGQFAEIWASVLSEAYASDGSAATPAQLLYMLWAMMAEKVVTGTTVTVRKLDGATTAMTMTLNDATNPSSITRSG